jgi:hypothetical protein
MEMKTDIDPNECVPDHHPKVRSRNRTHLVVTIQPELVQHLDKVVAGSFSNSMTSIMPPTFFTMNLMTSSVSATLVAFCAQVGSDVRWPELSYPFCEPAQDMSTAWA